MKLAILVLIGSTLIPSCLISPTIAKPIENITEKNKIDIAPEVLEKSPVLQKWLEQIPDVLSEIKQDPAFITRFQIGFTSFPSTDDAHGLNLGLKDVFIKHTGLTFSIDYQTAFNGDRNAMGANLDYFILPLGSYLNFAPRIGYRYIQSNDFFTDGINLGARLMLSFSRTGAGDISITQNFINLGSNEEIGLTTLSVGYALTSNLRISGDIEKQNSIEARDNRFGLNIEWLF